MAESSPNGQKTLWEKEKLLVLSNFSFSYTVFKLPVLQTRKNRGLFGKGLRDEKKILFTSIFSLKSHNSFKNFLSRSYQKWGLSGKGLFL